MSLFWKRDAGLTATQMVAELTSGRLRGTTRVSRDQAMRNSAVWACLRLRADLVSTMPVDVYRRVNGVQVEMKKPQVMVTPGGAAALRWDEWVYATQVDLDSVGNAVGVVLERDANRLPTVIELASIDEVSFVGRGNRLEKIRVGRKEYDPSEIWHERQFVRAGSPVGLSPIAHAAATLNSHLSAQEFAQEWFSNSTVPGGHLKNVNKTLDKAEARKVKESFKASVAAGDVWVSGNDWEYSMLSAKASESQFLELMSATIPDICRYLGTPADVIDAAVSGQSITYANIGQRNLQLLIINLGPAISRRENAWSTGLLPQPRYAKLNPGVLLRMDTKSRYEAHKVAIDSRFLAPSEVRDLEDLPPLTPEQLAEFNMFAKAPMPVAPMTPKE